MKSLLVTALLVAGLQTATTKTKSTRLRAEPRHGAPVVATVPEGTTLQMKGVAAEPYLVVEYEGQTAYVDKSWLNITSELERALAHPAADVEDTAQLDTLEQPTGAGLNRAVKVKRNTAIYEQPSVASKSLARLPDDETVRIMAKAEGNFFGRYSMVTFISWSWEHLGTESTQGDPQRFSEMRGLRGCRPAAS